MKFIGTTEIEVLANQPSVKMPPYYLCFLLENVNYQMGFFGFRYRMCIWLHLQKGRWMKKEGDEKRKVLIIYLRARI